jgi:protein-tyrosine phosphatase
MKRAPTSVGELYVGSFWDVQELLKESPPPHFDLIWNLAEELVDFESEETLCDRLLFGMIPDFAVPSDREFFFRQLGEVISALRNGKKVLTHCMEGHGRSGLALACIKMKLDGLQANAVLDFAMQICDGPENEDQCQFVRNLQ